MTGFIPRVSADTDRPPVRENTDMIHLDMDAFFASVEQRDVPFYRGKPLIVCHTDNPGSFKGVVSAASYKARVFGVGAGLSVLEAKKLVKTGFTSSATTTSISTPPGRSRTSASAFPTSSRSIRSTNSLSTGRYSYKLNS